MQVRGRECHVVRVPVRDEQRHDRFEMAEIGLSAGFADVPLMRPLGNATRLLEEGAHCRASMIR